MEYIFSFLIPMISVFALSCMFMVTGSGIARGILNEENICYRLAQDFFIGMICFLVAVRTVALLSRSYKFAGYLVLACFAVWTVSNILRRNKEQDIRTLFSRYRSLIFSGLILWIANIFYQLILWFVDLEQTVLSPSTNVGSQHSIRYANIAKYIVEHDHIPVFNQSYGQSLLGSVGMLMGIDNVDFYMSVWLAASKTFMILFIFGLLTKYFNRMLSVLLTVVILCGNVSLSPFPVKVLDTGSPFFFSGYTDSVVGVCSFYIFLVFIFQVLSKHDGLTTKHIAFTFCMILYWCMSAPQNVVVIGGIGLVVILLLFWKKEMRLAIPALCIAGAVLGSILIGIFEGGMLTPSSMAEKVSIDGLMTLDQNMVKGGGKDLPGSFYAVFYRQ